MLCVLKKTGSFKTHHSHAVGAGHFIKPAQSSNTSSNQNFFVFNRIIEKTDSKMKLLTHNLLTSRSIANVKEGYPLKIEVSHLGFKLWNFSTDGYQ